jgi:uncharacterized protein involved in exopolysaccharide biosynthesis
MDTGRLLERSSETGHRDSPRFANLEEMYGLPVRDRSLSDYGRMLIKRKWTVIVSVIVVVTMAALVSIRTTPIYDAVTRILISPELSSPLTLKDNNATQASDDQQRDIATKVKILQSDTMAELVVHRLNLDTRPDFAGTARMQTSGGIAVSEAPKVESARQEQLIRKLQSSIRIQQVPDTSLLEIRYSDPNPELAADVANGIASTFIEQNVKSRYDSTIQAADWLSRQLADLQVKIASQVGPVSEGTQHHWHG